MTSIATQMHAWAARTSRAPTDTRRLWIASPPPPASRTPGHPHAEEAEGARLAPAGEAARGRVPIRAAPPVEDLVDRVGLPALHEGRQGHRDREPGPVHGPGFRSRHR